MDVDNCLIDKKRSSSKTIFELIDKNVSVENNADKYDLEVNNKSKKKRVCIEESE